MRMPVGGTLLIYSENKALIKRLPFYFDEATRPDFPEEVPKSEAQWIDVFEVLEDPDAIRPIDDHHLAVSFYPEESDYSSEMQDLSEALIKQTGATQIIYYQLSEVDAQIYRLNTDGIYSIALSDGEDWNIKALSKATAKLLEENAYAEDDELFDLITTISKELVGVKIKRKKLEDDD